MGLYELSVLLHIAAAVSLLPGSPLDLPSADWSQPTAASTRQTRIAFVMVSSLSWLPRHPRSRGFCDVLPYDVGWSGRCSPATRN